MGKLKYILLLAVAVGLLAACTKQAQITGPAGAQGTAGVPGPNIYGIPIPESIDYNDFPGAGPVYVAGPYIFNGYNPTISYNLVVYGNKVAKPQQNEYYKLPWFNVYNAGDELYSAMKHDSMFIVYVSNAAWPNNSDSLVQLQLLVLPQQN